MKVCRVIFGQTNSRSEFSGGQCSAWCVEMGENHSALQFGDFVINGFKCFDIIINCKFAQLHWLIYLVKQSVKLC